MFDLLKKLVNAQSPSGNEENIRNIIKTEAEKYADEVTVDALGSLIVHKKGTGPRFMLASHMDEIGVIATYIEDNGMIRFSNVGWVSPLYSGFHAVRFMGGAVGVMAVEEKVELKDVKLSKCFIDIGAKNREEAEKLVKIGEAGVFVSDTVEANGKWISKALDNRVGCLVLLEVLKQIKTSPYDLYFVFTTQEELGLRGARPSAYSVNPEFALAVDVTDTGDTPNCTPMAVKLGGGPAIKVMDRSVICHKAIVNWMIETSAEAKLPYQLEVMEAGGTDAGAIHASRSGVITGGVSLPTRYIHSPVEVVDKSDVENSIKLIVAALGRNVL